MTSYSWRHNIQSRRIWKLYRTRNNYPCGPFKQALSQNILLKISSSA